MLNGKAFCLVNARYYSKYHLLERGSKKQLTTETPFNFSLFLFTVKEGSFQFLICFFFLSVSDISLMEEAVLELNSYLSHENGRLQELADILQEKHRIMSQEV